MFSRIIKGVFVIGIAALLTTFGVDAVDTLEKRGGTLLSQAITSQSPVCPDGMSVVSLADKRLCVDVFEVSPGENCPAPRVGSVIDTRGNVDTPSCLPESREDAFPWPHVTFHQAKELCAKAGKRLPTSEEWYGFSIGTPDPGDQSPCNIAGSGAVVGDRESSCKNPYGIYNTIGNVWEWVDGAVVEGAYNGRSLPESGYVVSADRDGMVTVTHPDEPNPSLHDDYFWSERAGEYGILRGGFYRSQSDGGLYSIQAKSAMSLASEAIGFRCVQDI